MNNEGGIGVQIFITVTLLFTVHVTLVRYNVTTRVGTLWGLVEELQGVHRQKVLEKIELNSI